MIVNLPLSIRSWGQLCYVSQAERILPEHLLPGKNLLLLPFSNSSGNLTPEGVVEIIETEIRMEGSRMDFIDGVKWNW